MPSVTYRLSNKNMGIISIYNTKTSWKISSKDSKMRKKRFIRAWKILKSKITTNETTTNNKYKN